MFYNYMLKAGPDNPEGGKGSQILAKRIRNIKVTFLTHYNLSGFPIIHTIKAIGTFIYFKYFSFPGA